MSRTLWADGREPGHQVVALAFALALTAVVLELAIDGEVGALFDIVFVLSSVGVALLVRPSDFFTVGVLPPLTMAVVFVLLAVSDPGALAHPDDVPVQAVISGLSTHSPALVLGYALCLGCLAWRHRVLALGAAGSALEPGRIARAPADDLR